jgi:hypothetical protein
MAASFDSSSTSAPGSLACVVLLSPGGRTRTRLEAVLRRPGLHAVFCDDALEALGEVTRACAGKGPASCVLLLDQPHTLSGLDEVFEAIPKFVELPIVWVFEPGPPVSLKDTPWEQALQLAQGRARAPGLGNPSGEPLPVKINPALAKPSANEWVASATESWSMPGLPAGAKASTRAPQPAPALRLTGEPLAPAPAPSGFDAPDALADATPQPKSSWLGAAAGPGQVLSDDELAMLLGPDGQADTGGFAAPKG